MKHAEIQEFDGDAAGGLDSHPHWLLVLRILASPQFARASRLKSFLAYVSRCALLDRANEVTEQQIGIHVFGRPADYHAGEDNIVRSQARFLRMKLAEYFDSPAGREERIILTVPKGSYLPHFEPAPAVAEAPPMGAPEKERRRIGRKVWIGGLVGLACIVLAAAWVAQWRVARRASADENSIWPRIFDSRQTTTLVASDYIFSMVQEAAGRALSLDEYLSADYFNLVASLNAGSGLDRLFPNIAQRHYTGFENVISIARLAGLNQGQSTHTLVRFARDLTMRDIGNGNVVLVGSKQSNPWVLLFEDKLRFRFEYDSASHSVFVVNHAPQSGEQSEYHPSALDATSRMIYGGVAFVPNLHRDGSVLILQGTSMGGTEAALDQLATPTLFQELVRRMKGRQSRDGGLPYFEALIRIETINGVVGGSSIAACATIP